MAEENNNRMELHEIPLRGRFGDIASCLNANFRLIIEAILKKRDGKSAYEIWVEQPGNEGKSLNEFLASLRESGFDSKAVLTLPEGSEINENTIYAVPEKSDPQLTDPDMWAEYIYQNSTWILLARHDDSVLGDLILGFRNLRIELNSTKNSVNRKAELAETEEDGAFFCGENGAVFLKYDDGGLDTNKVSNHFKELVAPDLSEYPTEQEVEEMIGDIPTPTTTLAETEESGAFFANEDGAVFMKYDNDGLDANKVSTHFKGLVAPDLSDYATKEYARALIPEGSGSGLVGVTEIGAFFTNELGQVFLKYDNNGLDTNNVSEHLKGLIVGRKRNTAVLKIPTLESTVKVLSVPDVKFNQTITFFGKVGTMGTLVISRGDPSVSSFTYSGSMVKIDSTNITAYNGMQSGTPTVVGTFAHGLTIENVVMVVINIESTVNASSVMTNSVKLTLATAASSGNLSECVYSAEWTGWKGCRSDLRVSMETGSMTDCEISWSSKDLFKDVWVFGDSYLDYWPKFAMAYGLNNALFDGFSGRASLAAKTSLDKALAIADSPTTILWAIGMNDNDGATASASVNANWKSVYDYVKAICENRGINLILCTIPNVKAESYYHVAKNTTIRNSGCQVIDISVAVGGETERNDWYSGFRTGTDVHPSSLGSRIIALKILQSVPNLIK